LKALRLDAAFPSSVRGPVDFSHGRQRRSANLAETGADEDENQQEAAREAAKWL